jgi:hypothetical protein
LGIGNSFEVFVSLLTFYKTPTDCYCTSTLKPTHHLSLFVSCWFVEKLSHRKLFVKPNRNQAKDPPPQKSEAEIGDGSCLLGI